MSKQKPALFGIHKSNRDFAQKEAWGKNQFNSSFPTALACYMASENIEPIYLKSGNDLNINHSTISTESLFGIKLSSENLFFAFESDFVPYQQLVIGNLPRIDLVIQDTKKRSCLRGLEIKLTALPDNTTCDLTEEQFGSEIVIRPDSIVYLALSIAINYKDKTEDLKKLLGNSFDSIKDWTEGSEIMLYIPEMIKSIDNVLLANINNQEPFIVQPIWKTIGKSPQLANNCLDIFVWSNFAFTRLFLNVVNRELSSENKITRQLRSIIWLLKMLLDFCNNDKIDHSKIIDELSYNTKNDKVFAISGKVSHPFMACAELTTPRIRKDEIKNIILGNGHLLLSPERRFDAIICNSPGLFN